MISTIEFAALGGSFVQVSAKREDVSAFVYRLKNLSIDTRFLPPEPSCPDQVFFSHIFEGTAVWHRASIFEEGPLEGSATHRRHYSQQQAPYYRRTRGDLLGLAIGVPRTWAPEVDEPVPMGGRIYADALELGLHMLERRDESSLDFVNAMLDGWIHHLHAEGFLPKRERRTTSAQDVRAAADREMLKALTGVLGATASRPAVVDLASALGLSERQIARRLQKVLPLIESPSKNFREMAHRWRILVAGVLMASRPDERISVIAEHAGFSSTAALDHCFKSAGLDSPTELLQQLSTR